MYHMHTLTRTFTELGKRKTGGVVANIHYESLNSNLFGDAPLPVNLFGNNNNNNGFAFGAANINPFGNMGDNLPALFAHLRGAQVSFVFCFTFLTRSIIMCVRVHAFV